MAYKHYFRRNLISKHIQIITAYIIILNPIFSGWRGLPARISWDVSSLTTSCRVQSTLSYHPWRAFSWHVKVSLWRCESDVKMRPNDNDSVESGRKDQHRRSDRHFCSISWDWFHSTHSILLFITLWKVQMLGYIIRCLLCTYLCLACNCRSQFLYYLDHIL